ncbi:thiol reductant ABC exporter subunit CydD [Neobacillus vireti]|uniref:thiol reductant ABC exporter subunit CydD n=1 Tax=Neobacillus vireti TaxID=220686 RepID=UPI003000850E
MEKSLFSYKGIKHLLLVLGLLTSLQAIMIILQAYYLANSISSLFGGDLFYTVWKKLLYFFLALLFRQSLTFVRKRLVYRFATETSVNLRAAVLKKLFQLGPRFVKEQGSGQTVTLIMEGTMKFHRYLELFLPKLVNTVIIPAAIFVFIFFENIRSAVILILALPILIIFMILLGLAAKEKANRQYKSYQMLSNHFVDSLRGIETMKYLGISQKHSEKIHFVSEGYRKNVMATLRIAFLSTFALDFITMLSIATVAVFLGLGLINGSMELKTALTVLILAPEYFLPIREVGADYHATLDGKEAGAKLQGILQKESIRQNKKSIPAWNESSVFSVKNISLYFDGQRHKGLKNLHFTVSERKKIGIIGASGSGKSTLIDLISGFLAPSEGEFIIDGKKCNHLCHEDWQQQLTYIPQHPYLFSDTVFNNIRFYEPSSNDQEVKAAADAAGLTEFIESLPRGLNTKVGEGGRDLSGGQEQRIALARAFLGNRPILLLDEPTAQLDIETEYALKGTMLQLFNDKLVFFATHRLHWMLEMDQILVLDNGKIVEAGTHEQLLAHQGYYYRLAKTFLEGK